MKLIIQIPCYNEEQTLPQTLRDIPRTVEGVDEVEVLIIDDGSSDRTVEVAKAQGVDHIVRHTGNRGLARTFRSGLNACLTRGADIIVNTDGDNQYNARDIPLLVRPIIEGRADIVVGDRKTAEVAHFSFFKKRLQAFGSFVVRMLSGVEVPDAVSGFRAISRDAALDLNFVSTFSYTIEMLIQAGSKRMAVISVPIRTNRVERKSRLFKSIPDFVSRSAATILRMYAMYRPLSVFSTIGLALGLIGTLPILRFLYFWSLGGGAGHVQSLVLGGSLVVIGFMALLVGMLADLINFNRRLIEIVLEKVRRVELQLDDGSMARRQGAQAPSGPLTPENITALAQRLRAEIEIARDREPDTEPAGSGVSHGTRGRQAG